MKIATIYSVKRFTEVNKMRAVNGDLSRIPLTPLTYKRAEV